MNLRQQSPANRYLETIHDAQFELLKSHITKLEFIAVLQKVEKLARDDSDISEVEYCLIRTIYEVARYE